MLFFTIYTYISAFSAFEQDLSDLAIQLPRLPADLPFVVVETADGRKQNFEIKVRPQVIRKALDWLIENNPWYSKYSINQENMEFYEQTQTITQDHLRSIVHDWEPTVEEELPTFRTMGEKDVLYEEDLSGDFPSPDGCVMTEVPSATNEDIITESITTAGKSTVPAQGPSNDAHPEQPLSSSPADLHEDIADDAPPAPAPAQERPTLAWPRKTKAPLSEFEPGYFAKCFPHLFPDGMGDFLMPVSGKLCLFYSLIQLFKNTKNYYFFKSNTTT